MSRLDRGRENHTRGAAGWLRAAVLGANDGIVSTASLIVGVAASPAGQGEIVVAGIAALVAGAMSMAAGEYVSVSSQADMEAADLDRERDELASDPGFEERELASIYVARGVDEALAFQVAQQLMARDALAAHARDELGISEHTAARPILAAVSSAAAFVIGAVLPLGAAVVSHRSEIIFVVAACSLFFLALLGAGGALVGRAPVLRAMLRVTFWGALAMALTAAVGKLAGIFV